MNEMGNVVVAVYELMGIIIKHPPVNNILLPECSCQVSANIFLNHGSVPIVMLTVGPSLFLVIFPESVQSLMAILAL